MKMRGVSILDCIPDPRLRGDKLRGDMLCRDKHLIPACAGTRIFKNFILRGERYGRKGV